MSTLRSVGALMLAAVLCLGFAGTTLGFAGRTAARSPAGPVASPGTGIEGIEWVLKQQASGGSLADLPAGTIATLLLESGQAAGIGGCNQFGGDYTLSGNSLTFGALLSTQMACPDPASTVESSYFANLATVATFVSDGGTLTLSDASGNAVLSYVAGTPPTALGSWVVTGYNNGKGAVTSPLAGTFLTIIVSSDGTLSGSAGCNHYFGSYTVDGNNVTVSPLGTTRMACPSGDVQDQETQFLAALQMTESYAKDASGLTLTNNTQLNGGTTVTAVPAHREDYVGAWEAIGINSGNGSVNPPAAGRAVTAVFGANGEVEGNTGCNAYSGPYTVNGDSMSIGPILSTYAACGSPLMETQQQQFLNALQSTATWAVDEFGLTLSDSTGDLMVQFNPLTNPNP